MAKKTGRSPEPPDKTTVKIPSDLARKARVVAVLRNIDLFDYLEGVLRQCVERDYQRAIDEEAKGKD
jgi:hypothetical protein